jgi:hypothetical protein
VSEVVRAVGVAAVVGAAPRGFGTVEVAALTKQ